MAKNYLVTLTTDFGTEGPYAGAMKGALLRACPRAQIVDISHDVPPHNILAGAFVLAHSAPQFPSDTLHVVVVDPGVGTQRRLLAAQFGDQCFLFPDNGVISLIAQSMPLRAIFSVRDPRFMPPAASTTFQGRDILAPLAGAILNGLEISKLGPQPDKYALLDLPVPVKNEKSLVGQVLYIDHFGNLVSNISLPEIQAHWPHLENVQISCGGRTVGTIQPSYGFVPPRDALAVINSMGLLEVAANQARAADVLHAAVGAEVKVESK